MSAPSTPISKIVIPAKRIPICLTEEKATKDFKSDWLIQTKALIKDPQIEIIIIKS